MKLINIENIKTQRLTKIIYIFSVIKLFQELSILPVSEKI
jgi:hypothetical protein